MDKHAIYCGILRVLLVMWEFFCENIKNIPIWFPINYISLTFISMSILGVQNMV